jgi:putative glycosyltransferase
LLDGFTGDFHARASAAAEAVIGNDYEILLLDDGSPDRSLNLRSLPYVTTADLSRSFGRQKSMMRGSGARLWRFRLPYR